MTQPAAPKKKGDKVIRLPSFTRNIGLHWTRLRRRSDTCSRLQVLGHLLLLQQEGVPLLRQLPLPSLHLARLLALFFLSGELFTEKKAGELPGVVVFQDYFTEKSRGVFCPVLGIRKMAAQKRKPQGRSQVNSLWESDSCFCFFCLRQSIAANGTRQDQTCQSDNPIRQTRPDSKLTQRARSSALGAQNKKGPHETIEGVLHVGRLPRPLAGHLPRKPSCSVTVKGTPFGEDHW